MLGYCRFDVQPVLFGEWCLMREWGRITSAECVGIVPFPTAKGGSCLYNQRLVKESRGHHGHRG